MTEFRLNHLDGLHWLWIVAAVAGVLAWGLVARRRALERFAAPRIVSLLVARTSFGLQYVRASLIVGTAVALVVALLDPRWGVTFRQVPQRGVDIMIVLDISKSMLAEDARPNRLARAKQFIGDLLQQLGADRVGLVTFAGNAVLACPLTIDDHAFRYTLDDVGPESAGRGGSLLGDALRVASASFTDQIPDHKAILVFSDGEDQESYPMEAVQNIRQTRQVPIYTFGIGDEIDGARIPFDDDGRRRWVTYEGETVVSRMNASLLRDLAIAGGGAFVPVGTATLDMKRLYETRIRPVARREFEAVSVKQHHARFQWFAGVALVLLLAESWMGDGRRTPRTMEDE